MLNALATPLPLYAYPLIGSIFILLFALRGYIRGVFKELFGILSLVAAYIFAMPLGWLFLFIPSMQELPNLIQRPITKACGGALAYVIARITFFIIAKRFALYEKFEKKKQRLIRIGGVILGGFFGAIILLLICWFILIMGKVTSMVPGLQNSERTDLLTLPARIINTHYVPLKESSLGTVAEKTNPISDTMDIGLDIATKILENPDKMQKLLEYEPIAETMREEAVQNLMQNKEIRIMATENDIFGILNHPATQEMLEDHTIRETMQEVDLEELLELLITE